MSAIFLLLRIYNKKVESKIMQKQKTPHDVRGFQIKCVNYIQCPLCYGCRNYDFRDPECIKCKEYNSKKNLCNTKLHRGDLIAKMLTKSTLDMRNEDIQFKSFND